MCAHVHIAHGHNPSTCLVNARNANKTHPFVIHVASENLLRWVVVHFILQALCGDKVYMNCDLCTCTSLNCPIQ